MRDEFAENLKKKRQLVEEAEALKESTDWKETTDKLVELQKQWKAIGPVARKYSDDLWKMFTTACDTFFEAKRVATKEAREVFAQKRAEAKERWAKKVDQMTDRQKLIKMYENLVQEIKTAENNILFFTGKSKSGNKLVDDMRKKIDTLKEQLADLEKKINQMDAE
jgi:chromosome segregation ATPase